MADGDVRHAQVGLKVDKPVLLDPLADGGLAYPQLPYVPRPQTMRWSVAESIESVVCG
jgi:hypothetical protein